MSQTQRKARKAKVKTKVQIPDLKPKVEAKGGDGLSLSYSNPEVKYKQQ